MYLIVSCYFIGISIWEQIKSKATNANLVIAFSAILLAVLAGIRCEIGTDYPGYYRSFEQLLQNPNSCPEFEFGWRYLTYALSFFGCNVYGVFAFWACMAIWPLYHGLRRFSPYPLLSFCCFFLVYNAPCLYNFMRQCVVMCVLIGSIGLIKERRHVPLIFIFCFAYSIHHSVIVLPFFYILMQIKPLEQINRFGFVLLFLALIMGILSIPRTLILEFGSMVLPGYIYEKAYIYFVYWHGSLSVINILQRMFVIVPSLIFYKHLVQVWKYNEVTIKLYFWGCVAYLLLADSYDVATRLSTTTKILEIIIVPSFLGIVSNKMKIFVFTLIILWGVSVFYDFLFLAEYRELYYPFRTIFTNAF